MHQNILKPRPGLKSDHGGTTSRVTAQRQQVANLLGSGYTLEAIAKIIGKSISRVHAIHNELRGKKNKPHVRPRKLVKEWKPWNKMPPEKEAAIVEMIRAGESYPVIQRQLDIGQSAIQRVAAKMRGTSTAIQPSRKTDYREVFRAAEAYRQEQLAKRRAELRGGGV